jgi:hypothetical protein
MKPPRATRAQTKPANKKNIANPTLLLDVVAIGWPLRLAELPVVAGKLSTCTRAPDNNAIAPRMPMVSARVGFLSPDETRNPWTRSLTWEYNAVVPRNSNNPTKKW